MEFGTICVTRGKNNYLTSQTIFWEFSEQRVFPFCNSCNS
jgi:hypothetical protein